MLPGFNYTRPETLKQAVKEASSSGAQLHAGGTDLLGCLHDGVFPAEKLVSLSALDEMKSIGKRSDGGLRVGALATIHAISQEDRIRTAYAALAQAASEVASPQLRRQGTLGGNLGQKPRCWYYRGDFPCLRKGGKKCFAFSGQNQFHCILGGSACYIVHPSDTAPALIALDATLQINGPRGKRSLAVADLHVPPKEDPQRETWLENGEIITAIDLPAARNNLLSSYRKVRARQSWDFAVAGLALALELDAGRVRRSRIVLSGAAPIPWRSREAEQELAGKELTPETVRRAANAAMADAKPLQHNEYKIPLFKGLIEEELLKYAG